MAAQLTPSAALTRATPPRGGVEEFGAGGLRRPATLSVLPMLRTVGGSSGS
jgi:hypothetical protein